MALQGVIEIVEEEGGNDTICLTSGTYFLEATITTDLHLVGQDVSSTLLTTMGTDSIVTCDGCNATFENLTFKAMSSALTISYGEPTLRNLLFVANSSLEDGAAVSMANAQPVLTDITFASNNTTQTGGNLCH